MVPAREALKKAPTGIRGLDEITQGGLPAGRPTLVCGGPGCGKTLMAMEFIVRGATAYDEPGVFVAFEESAEELAQNVASLGFDLDALIADKRLAVDYVSLEPNDAEATGDFDLEGLFLRLGYAIDSVGAKRVALDTLEVLFAALPSPAILRAELHRLFRWLKGRGVTVILTGERGDGELTRHGLEEYVSDCVIVLQHELSNQISTRRLRVLKYRGSSHGTNDYPFLIDQDGLSVLPITSLGLEHSVSEERISSGVPRLDAMLSGEGFFRGSSILISGTAGTGKTSLAGHFTHAACARGERVLYFAFEESPSQITRNLRSIGLDLAPWADQGLLTFHARRPSFAGLEMHLAMMHKSIHSFAPHCVILDPLNSFIGASELLEVKAMLVRLLDHLKRAGITGFFTSLTVGGGAADHTDVAISSLIDTWLMLSAVDTGGERNRRLAIIKSRGMAHSNQTREFMLTAQGVELRDVYTGSAGVLTGSARLAQEQREQEAQLAYEQEIERQQRELERHRAVLDAQVAALKAEFELREAAALATIDRQRRQQARDHQTRAEMAVSRHADAGTPPGDAS